MIIMITIIIIIIIIIIITIIIIEKHCKLRYILVRSSPG